MKIIKNITTEGLLYIDETGQEGFVDFKHCNDNWIQYRKRTEQLNDISVDDLKKHDICVGQRDTCAQPCFIDFFTHPKFTRFEFKEISSSEELGYSFNRLQQAIIAAGWNTLDLS